MAYEFWEDEIRLRLQDEGRTRVRRMSRGHPPAFFLQTSTPDPAAPLLGQHLRPSEAELEIWWLPFLDLVEQGRFVRMQDCDRLTGRLEPDAFYLFVSHRWRGLADPDPGGGQAAAVAWQMVAEAVEAIWVRAARGEEPRRRSRFGHTHVGPRGSELAESILVNLLQSVDENDFAALVREAESFDDIEADRGVRFAIEGGGLARLRARLSGTPAIRKFLSRFRLWYDFTCMPQQPRTEAEQARFELMLQRQTVVQALGRTAVLLDDIADYFGRGWCSYESILAYRHLSETLDVWAETGRALSRAGSTIAAFMRVLEDRPHILWRALLDTDLFALQTPEECMARLGLQTTRPEDRGIVYSLLKKLGVPKGIHFDDGEVVTGVFPLPMVDGKAAVVNRTGHRLNSERSSEAAPLDVSFDSDARPSLGPAGLPPWHEFDDEPGDRLSQADRRTAHVAVIGSCEGEAILFTHRVLEHRRALEAALQVRIRSLSWLASDVAPVGHFAAGTLSVRFVHCDSWILVGTHASLVAGVTTALLVETLWSTRIDHAELEIDQTKDPLKIYAKAHAPAKGGDEDDLLRFAPDDPKLSGIQDALFRPEFMKRLGVQLSAMEQQ